MHDIEEPFIGCKEIPRASYHYKFRQVINNSLTYLINVQYCTTGCILVPLSNCLHAPVTVCWQCIFILFCIGNIRNFL